MYEYIFAKAEKIPVLLSMQGTHMFFLMKEKLLLTKKKTLTLPKKRPESLMTIFVLLLK